MTYALLPIVLLAICGIYFICWKFYQIGYEKRDRERDLNCKSCMFDKDCKGCISDLKQLGSELDQLGSEFGIAEQNSEC